MAPKAKPKPSLSAANAQTPSLEDLFSSLYRHSEKFEYDQCVKTADQVLSIAPGDEDAIRCKIVALIKSDSMDKALSAILAAEGLPIDLKFYKAYCLYRQNKLQDALESLNNQERSPMVLQLESQILYRLGKMDACMQSYDKLQKIKVDSIDVKTNIIATLVSAGRSNEVQGVMDALKVKASNSFELAYNTACSLIEKKKYAEAEQQLLSARRIGQEMLMEEDYADEEIETELAPISVQLAYIQQLLGRKQEAMEAYINIISRNLADAPSLAIATNNLIALKGGAKDASDGLRKLDKLMEKKGEDGSFKLAGGLDFKLSQRQKESLYANRLLLLLHTNRMDQARELASALPEMFPGSTVAVLLQAAVLVKEKKIPRVEELLLHFAEKFPEKSKAILLARAQISAAGGRPQIAAESLSMMHDVRHMPAVVATMVSLKERVGDLEGACSALDSTIQFWSEGAMMTEEDNGVMLGVIMPEAAAFKLRHGREGEAFELYERLVQQHGKNSNAEALAGLVKTAARIDLAKAELYERWLKELPGTIADAETLEKSCGAATGKMEEKEEKQSKGKRKRKRKAKRYPKGFDPANPGPPPDPERWLPRKERSSYRPKRKDKRVLQVRGSQGAVARDKHHDSNTSSASSAATPNNNAPPIQKLPGQISKGRRKK